MTPERIKNYQTVMGMAITNPEQFLRVDTTKTDLPFAQQDKIFSKQQSMLNKNLNTSQVNSVLNNAVVKSVMQSVGFPPPKDDAAANSRYNQFVGGLNQALEEYRETKKTDMPPAEYQKLAGQLVADAAKNWIFENPKNFQPPSDFKKEWEEKLTKHLGYKPSDVDWGGFYRHVVTLRARDAAK